VSQIIRARGPDKTDMDGGWVGGWVGGKMGGWGAGWLDRLSQRRVFRISVVYLTPDLGTCAHQLSNWPVGALCRAASSVGVRGWLSPPRAYVHFIKDLVLRPNCMSASGVLKLPLTCLT